MSGAEGLAKRSRDPLQHTQPQIDDGEKPKNKEKHPKHKKGLKSLLLATSLPLVLGLTDAILFSQNHKLYHQLQKPWWTPPGWLMVAVWSVLYSAMGLASWIVWARRGPRQRALALYLLMLALNLAWPYLFFGRHHLRVALVEIWALAAVVAACVAEFGKVNHVAGSLLVPYLAWILFVAALNYSVWSMNRAEPPRKFIMHVDE